MVLKSAESFAHAMISTLLPYLLWKHSPLFGMEAAVISEWFKLVACTQAADAYWDPKEECIKNQSNKMLAQLSTEDDDFYWIADIPAPSPKSKCTQAEDESLDDSIFTVKTAARNKKKQLKLAFKRMSLGEIPGWLKGWRHRPVPLMQPKCRFGTKFEQQKKYAPWHGKLKWLWGATFINGH